MLIGLVGPLKNGKSTAANRLCLQHGYQLLKFAGALKAGLYAMGLNHDMIEGHLKEEPLDMLCGKSPRWLMQSLGTDWGRKMIGEDFWVRLWQFKCQNLLDGGDKVVCDDVRFFNEARAIKEMGGVLIRVVRPGFAEYTGHASEAEGPRIECHLTIENDGTIDQLDASVDATVGWLRDYDFNKMRQQALFSTGAL